MDSACFSPFSPRPSPLFPLKKLLKMSTAFTADNAYENHVQFMWEIRGKSQNFAETPLLKTLWNTCGEVADIKWKSSGKGPAGTSRHFLVTFCKYE
jgi:REP element-mobilizing transposase RayT